MIDFTWFYFIGRTKLNLTFTETGRMTLRLFNKLYEHYKSDWSREMAMAATHQTYDMIKNQIRENEDVL